MDLFRANTETDFNKIVNTLKKSGYVWATDFPGEPTFKQCKKFFHGNSKLIIHASFNDITNKHEMCATTLSVLKTYPQYKKLRKEMIK